MLQRSALAGQPRRPIYQEVRQLSDAQLSIMCQSHHIFPGPITFRNRRQAERQLHIALIEERAKFRAQQQFAEECRLRHSGDPNFRPGPPPPQQHYDFRADLLQPEAPSPHYWPMPRTVNMRFNPVPSSGIQFRQEPILEPRQYVSWQQQNQVHQQAQQQSFHQQAEQQSFHQQAQRQSFHQPAKNNANPNAGGTEINFLGFKLPFSLETAREITTKIGETLKRFQGVGENQAATRFEGGSVNQKEGEYDEQSESDVDVPHQKHQSLYQASDQDDESEGEYQADEFEMEDLKMSDEDYNYPRCDRDTLCDQWEPQTCAPPLPFEYREVKPLAQTNKSEDSSCASMATIYHDIFSQQPRKRAADHFWWWWWPQRESAGDDRIPEAEQTRETEHKHEREVKSIHYLNDSALHVDDDVMELMQRVELREDSEEEDLVVLPDGTLSTQPMPRTYGGFCRTIFRLLLCDQNSNLDPAKLSRAFLGCCLAFAIYMSIRMIE